MSKAQPNEHGVRWAASQSGRLQIAVGRVGVGDTYQVWAIYTGTHDLAPRTRGFGDDLAAANEYANRLWKDLP